MVKIVETYVGFQNMESSERVLMLLRMHKRGILVSKQNMQLRGVLKRIKLFGWNCSKVENVNLMMRGEFEINRIYDRVF